MQKTIILVNVPSTTYIQSRDFKNYTVDDMWVELDMKPNVY